MTPMIKTKITYRMTMNAGQFLNDNSTIGVIEGRMRVSSMTA